MEIPKQQGVFKSKIERFRNKTQYATPGPGAYIHDQGASVKAQEHIKPQNVTQALRSQNEYIQIPSIPGVNEIYGYTDDGSICNITSEQAHSEHPSDPETRGHQGGQGRAGLVLNVRPVFIADP